LTALVQCVEAPDSGEPRRGGRHDVTLVSIGARLAVLHGSKWYIRSRHLP
jgi:hypothetical protein